MSTTGLDRVIEARERDLGGFSVRRILPYATHRMVGPFIFFDHMGPAVFPPGKGMDVRPHPHVNLATVTYLFEGAIFHQDSLGSRQLIEPGAINWMTAGHGIVHSERTPEETRAAGGRVHGIQCWVALPKEFEEIDPSFAHHSADSIPETFLGGARVRLLLGEGFGLKSQVLTHSDIVYAEVLFSASGGELVVPAGSSRDLAVYIVEGTATIDGQEMKPCTMAIAKAGEDLAIKTTGGARMMVIGGRPLEGKRFIWWNFVSSSEERLERAKKDWAEGRFPRIETDAVEFIPLPAEAGMKTNPPGTIL